MFKGVNKIQDRHHYAKCVCVRTYFSLCYQVTDWARSSNTPFAAVMHDCDWGGDGEKSVWEELVDFYADSPLNPQWVVSYYCFSGIVTRAAGFNRTSMLRLANESNIMLHVEEIYRKAASGVSSSKIALTSGLRDRAMLAGVEPKEIFEQFASSTGVDWVLRYLWQHANGYRPPTRELAYLAWSVYACHPEVYLGRGYPPDWRFKHKFNDYFRKGFDGGVEATDVTGIFACV